MNYINFFSDNKSGWKCKENSLKKHNPEIFEDIINFINKNKCLNDLPFKQKIWHFINNINEIPKCYCGKHTNFNGDLNKGYREYCSIQCSLNCSKTILKIKKTNLKRYGVENPSQNEEIKNKTKKTNLEKYGVEYQISSEKTINKTKKTNLEKYGVENVFQYDGIKNKIKKTNLEKYGVEYPTQSKIIFDKIKKTNLKKYNVENISKLNSVKKIISEKMLGRIIKKEWIIKSIETRYGVDYNDYEKLKSEFYLYKRDVIRITQRQPVHTLNNFNKRGKSGVNGAYQLDHKYSIFEGFKNKIEAEIIGNINNLEFIPWEVNNKKRDKSTITIDNLKKLINE